MKTALILSCALAVLGTACADNADLNKSMASPTTNGTAVGSNGAGTSTSTSTNTNTNTSTSTSTSASNTGQDSGPPELPMPTAAAPCDEDLEFVGGEVRPELGTVPEGGAFTAKPDEAGAQKVFSQDVKVPIAKEDASLLGYDISIEAGELSGTLYAPSADGTSVDSANGPYPLVLVLPGFQTSYSMYSDYAEHFASHGFMVLGVDTRSQLNEGSHDKEALEIMRSIDWILSTSSVAADIDATKIAVSGHSKGGKVSFFAAAIDERIDQVIAWDPQNSGGPPCGIGSPEACNALPVAPNCAAVDAMLMQPEGVLQHMHAASLVLGAPPDGLITPDPNHNCEHFYRGAPTPAAFVNFDDGHVAWLPSLGNADVIRISKAVQMATLLTAFKGHTGLEDYLPSGTYLEKEPKVLDVHFK